MTNYENTEEFAKFVSAVNTYPTDENGEGIAKTSDYLYLYYRGIGERIIPFASVYMNEQESQNVVNAILERIKDEGDRDIRGWFDRIDEGVRNVESENDILSGTDQESSNTSANGKMGAKLSRKGRYFDTPELYSKVKRADSGSRGQGRVNYSLRELDAPYLDAVERGDMQTAQRMVLEAAKRAGYLSDTSYQGSLAFNGAAPVENDYFETKEQRKEAWDNGDYVVGDVYHALIPIIKENLEIQKQLYNGERGNHIVLGRGVSKESNYPQQEQEYSRGYNRRGNRPLESQPRVLGGDREGEISAEDRGAEVAQRLPISQKLTDEKAEPRYSFQYLPFFVDDEGDVFYFNDDTEVTDRPRNVQLLHYNLGELVPRSGVTG